MGLRETFKDQLIAFFEKHDERQLVIVDDIVKQFRGSEEIVMEHLCKTYNIDPESLGLDLSKAAIDEHEEVHAVKEALAAPKAETETETETPKPKKPKKKLIIIIAAVLVLGGAAFMLKDKLMGGGGNTEKTEEPAKESSVAAPAPVEQPAAAEAKPAETADSTAVEPPKED